MIELDAIDKKAASVLDGYLVRKDLVRTFSRQFPVPTYVVEFMLGRYCASTDQEEIDEGLEIVQRQLKSRTVRAGEEELFKARARETGEVERLQGIRRQLITDDLQLTIRNRLGLQRGGHGESQVGGVVGRHEHLPVADVQTVDGCELTGLGNESHQFE